MIYLATDHAPREQRGLGPLASYLLTQRPCRIIIIETNLAKGGAGWRAQARQQG
jgi:hypothetical protein